MPQVGYYDTTKAYNRHVAQRVRNPVKMSQELDRDYKFMGKGAQQSQDRSDEWGILDFKPLVNLWENLPQSGDATFKGQMSRAEQTKAMGFNETKWLYQKSAGDIKRAKETKALKEYITANIEKIKDGATVATDENVEL